MHEVRYSSTMLDQMGALINGSSACQQSIQFHCLSTPLIDTVSDHRELLFEKLKKMDQESCVDPLTVKMLRETTSEPETTGKV